MKPNRNTRAHAALQAASPIELTITSGRESIGRIVDRASQCTAFTADGRALEERKARLATRAVRKDRKADFLDFLRREVWPAVPRRHRRRRLSTKEEDAILGYGPEGV